MDFLPHSHQLRTELVVLALFASVTCTPAADPEPSLPSGPDDCSVEVRHLWLHSLMHEKYLWYEHVPELDEEEIVAFETAQELLDSLVYDEIDEWSNIKNKQVADDKNKEGKGLAFGYKTARDGDGNKYVGFVNDPSPALDAGLLRGDLIIDQEYLDEDRLHVALEIVRPDGSEQTIEIEKDTVEYATVPYDHVIDEEQQRYGYLMFRTFIEPSRDALDEAFAGFATAGVDKVIIDLRYNGGGLLKIARHFGDLIAGVRAAGEISYGKQHNVLMSDEDEFNHYSVVDGSLPIEEVVFITGSGTASASEILINMISPYVKTTIVGQTTGGKPVGMYTYDLCDDVVYPISFKMVNSEGYGDYYDGLVPDCLAADDFFHELGDNEEASLAEALHVLRTGACSPQDRAGSRTPVSFYFVTAVDDELDARYGGAIEARR